MTRTLWPCHAALAGSCGVPAWSHKAYPNPRPVSHTGQGFSSLTSLGLELGLQPRMAQGSQARQQGHPCGSATWHRRRPLEPWNTGCECPAALSTGTSAQGVAAGLLPSFLPPSAAAERTVPVLVQDRHQARGLLSTGGPRKERGKVA